MDGSLKSQPFTCYFCNKVISNDTEFGHVSSCGLVLEPCVNKCGSYVPRNMKTRHLKECKNRRAKSVTRLNSYEDYNPINSDKVQKYDIHTRSLDRSKENANSNFQTFEMGQLLQKYHNLDQTCKELAQTINYLKVKHQEGLQHQQTTHIQVQMQLEKLRYQNQIVSEWKRNTEMHVDNIRQDVKYFQKLQHEFEVSMANLKSTVSRLQKAESELTALKQQSHERHLEHRETTNDIKVSLGELKDRVVQENAVIAALWNDNKADVGKLLQEVSAVNEAIIEGKAKHASLVFDVRAASQTCAETSDKLEILERSVGDMKKELSQLKSDMQCMEESSVQHFDAAGCLLWKITGFSKKMENAKENNVVLKSPIFYSHRYGYKIRLQIYLNGIKKWKGRHMIACLHVLKGEYDLLLKWPCNIEGTVSLKDLLNITSPKDYSKLICAKRRHGDEENEEPQESSTQYIFIPHSILTKQIYVQSDTIFLEIQIKSTNKSREETEL